MIHLKDKFKNIATPFYYYDMDLLAKTLDIVKAESSKYGFNVHYAVKANYDDKIMQTIAAHGFGADCVSGGEVAKSLEMGFKHQDIVFAGVGKSDAEINTALDADIFSFNCESLEELSVINELAALKGKVANVALRLNPDVDPQTHAYITTGKAENKFGIPFHEVDTFVEMLPTLTNIKFIGIHFHIGSQITNLSVFKELCERVETFVKWFEERGIRVESINLGGGLGIDYQNPDVNPIAPFADYFKIIADNLKVAEGRSIHFELGRSVVGQCGTLVSRVLFNKTTAAGTQYAIIDGSMTELLRPALYSAYHEVANISSTDTNSTYHIAGGVCESTDLFAKDISLPATKRGDFIVIRSAGAYGSAMASTYNLRPLPCSVYSDTIDNL